MTTFQYQSPAARALRRIMEADRRRDERTPSLGKKCRVIARSESQHAAPVGMLVWVAWQDQSDPNYCTVYEAKRTPTPEHERRYYVNHRDTLRVIPQK